MTQLDNFVSPEFETNRLSHAEAVNVEDAAAHTELGHIFNHRSSFESNRFEMRCQIFWSAVVALPELQTGTRKRGWKLRPFQNRAGGSQKNSDIAPRESLQRLHPLAGDFCVWLRFAE